MAFRSLRANLSRLWKTKDTTSETPQFYLNHIEKCMKHVDSMVAFGASPSVKFNHEQCKYLAEKLRGAVRSALSFLQSIKTWNSHYASDEGRRWCLQIFKLLFVSSKEAESFIQGCSEAAWVQFAIVSTNVSEHIASLGFDFELCTIVFSISRKIFKDSSTLSDADVVRIRKAEGEIVKERAHLDLLRLQNDVEALSVESRRAGSEDEQRAMFLLERLQTSRLHPEGDLPTSNLSSRPERRLKPGQQLGKGASGIVHKANWLGLDVARKAFHDSSVPDFEREVKILEGLCHPNIVSLLWHARDKHNWPYMVLELMDGDLSSFMEERMVECETVGDSPFSILEAVHMMLQVGEGMRFLHDKGIVHRDLKSGNILVKHVKATEVGTVSYVHVKVADFGLSRTKEKSKTYSNQTVNQGTTRWMAPEMMRIVNDDGHGEFQGEGELRYPFKVDVYSFAMVCFEILTGDMPFPNLTPNEVKKKVLDGERPQIPDHCPERLRSLIEACWRREPEERPRFGVICDELRHIKCAYLMSGACVRAAPRCFSLEEIKKMTNNFSDSSRMPKYRYGEMYKGVIDDTGEVVGVVRALDCGFKENLEVLPRLHQSNVVGYAGSCTEKGENILVFEYMPNGSLAHWLDGDASRKVKLTWPVRRNICLSVADGIHYLHSVSQPIGGISAYSILLDKNLEPKFLGSSLSFIVRGFYRETAQVRFLGRTSGYVAPEYFRGRLSQKFDVYSFGVVLLAIVFLRRAVDRSLHTEDEVYLVDWAKRIFSEGRGRTLINCSPDLQADEEMEAVRIIQIAMMCVEYEAERRPDMGLVVAMLRGDVDPDVSCYEGILEDGRVRLENESRSFKTSDWTELSPVSSVSTAGSSGGERFGVEWPEL